MESEAFSLLQRLHAQVIRNNTYSTRINWSSVGIESNLNDLEGGAAQVRSRVLVLVHRNEACIKST